MSILGQRGTLGITLADLAKDEPRVVALTADLRNTSGLDRFAAAFPDRFFNVGIAEQNMIGIAAGLAAGGNIPFAATFSNFASLRACEQIRHFMSYMRENVKLVGFGAGFSMGMFGVTHYAVEDLAAIRAMNDIVILSPSDGLSVYKAVRAAALHEGPVYLRLTGVMNSKIIYKEDYDFQIGKAVVLPGGGGEIAILAAGSLLNAAMGAAGLLEERDGIAATVADVHTIKPIDGELLDRLSGCELIVTVEEHGTVGGLASAVSEYYAAKGKRPRQLPIGVSGPYQNAGDYAYMLEQYGLTEKAIYEKIIVALAK